jgi:hypothetical protein
MGRFAGWLLYLAPPAGCRIAGDGDRSKLAAYCPMRSPETDPLGSPDGEGQWGESRGPRGRCPHGLPDQFSVHVRYSSAKTTPGEDREQMDRAFCRRAAGLRLQCRGC